MGSDKQKKRGAILLWIQQGGVHGHSDGRSPKDGREQASEGRSVGLTSASKHIWGELRALIRHPWLQSPG